jgi:hypothetical protein
MCNTVNTKEGQRLLRVSSEIAGEGKGKVKSGSG